MKLFYMKIRLKLIRLWIPTVNFTERAHNNQTDNFNAMIVEPAVAWQPKRSVVEMGPLKQLHGIMSHMQIL